MKLSRLASIAVLFALTAWLVAGCGGGDDETTEAGGGAAETTVADETTVSEETAAEDESEDRVIRLGSLFATEGAGEPFGPQQVAGAQLAVDEINAAGGVAGAQLELIQADGDGDPGKAVNLANDLIDDEEVLAVLGATFSNTSTSVHPLADELGVPMLAVSNTSTGIVGNCDYPCSLVFRDSLGEESAIPANIRSFLDRAGLKGGPPGTAVVIHPDDDPFGETSAGIAQKAFADAGLAETPVVHGRTAVSRAVKMRPRVVMVTASSGELAAKLVQQLRQAGYHGPILGGNAFNSRLTGELMGRAGRGVQVAAAWFAGNRSAANRDFIAAYRSANGEPPDQFAAQAYAGVQLLAAAAEAADLTFTDLEADRLALAEALADVSVETPLGPLSFTPDHDISQPIWIVRHNGQGAFRLVEKVPAGAAKE